MKLRTEMKPLLALLQTVSTAVGSKTTHEVLSGILLESQGGTVVATAYDMEIGIQQVLPHEAERCLEIIEDGSVVIPAKQFIDILRKLTGNHIFIEVNAKKHITVQSGEFECEFRGLQGDMFPRLPRVSTQETTVVPARVLKDLVRSTVFATSKSESRPILTGVYVEFGHGHLRFSATDSLRLATRSIPFYEEGDIQSAIIPSRSLNALVHVLPEDDAPVTIAITKNYCMFRIGTLELCTRTIGGTFVDVTRLVPRTFTTEIVLSTDDLICSLDRAAVIAPRNHEVNLTLNAERTFITTKSPEYGNLTDAIPTKSVHGTDMSIAFNAKNVLEALRTLQSQETVLRLSGPNQPFVLCPSDDEAFVHVISPIVTR